MRKRQIRILVILSAVSLVLGLVLAVLSRGAAPQKAQLLLQQAQQALTQLSFENAAGQTTLVKTDDGWQLADDASFPVSAQAAQTLVQALFETQVSQRIAVQSESAMQEYGLDAPQCRIETRFSDGTRHTLCVGSMNASTQQLYVRVDSQLELCLTDAELLRAFSAGVLDLMELPQIPAPQTQLRVQLENENGTVLISAQGSQTGGEDGVWYIRQDGGFTPADETAAYNLRCLTWDLRWRACAAYQADAALMERCGLASPRAVYTLEYPEAEQIITFTIRFGGALSDGSCFAAADDGNIYLLDELAADWLASLTAADFLPEQAQKGEES